MPYVRENSDYVYYCSGKELLRLAEPPHFLIDRGGPGRSVVLSHGDYERCEAKRKRLQRAADLFDTTAVIDLVIYQPDFLEDANALIDTCGYFDQFESLKTCPGTTVS